MGSIIKYLCTEGTALYSLTSDYEYRKTDMLRKLQAEAEIYGASKMDFLMAPYLKGLFFVPGTEPRGWKMFPNSNPIVDLETGRLMRAYRGVGKGKGIKDLKARWKYIYTMSAGSYAKFLGLGCADPMEITFQRIKYNKVVIHISEKWIPKINLNGCQELGVGDYVSLCAAHAVPVVNLNRYNNEK